MASTGSCIVRSVATAVPKYEYSREQIAEVGRMWLGDTSEQGELFARFLSSSRTDRRHFAIPAEEILSLNGLHGRSVHFEREGPKLGVQAVGRALSRAAANPETVDTLLFTSCSCPPIPSIDALVLEQSGLRRSVNRIPIYQHGCAGGVVGLGIASTLARGGQTVLLNSVELCSLVFHAQNPSAAELVGSAIFADGAASAVVAPGDKGLVIRKHQSYLLPNARHLMGYDVQDDGFHLRLDRELPKALSEAAPERVTEFLSSEGLQATDIQHWLFHPGGIKILDILEQAFALRPEQAPWSRQILQQYGNISSATVLFVLEAFLQSGQLKAGDRALMVGVGPGLTLETVLFENVV